jgi:hypothetical protein
MFGFSRQGTLSTQPVRRPCGMCGVYRMEPGWRSVVQSLQSFAHAPVAAKARDWPFPSELVK